jgi:hypothetical protein
MEQKQSWRKRNAKKTQTEKNENKTKREFPATGYRERGQ